MKFRFYPSTFTLMLLMAGMFAFLLSPITLLAQEAGQAVQPQTGFDITGMFTSTASLAAFIIAAVQFLRAHVWKTLDGLVLVGITFAVGIGLGALGFYLHLLPGALTVTEGLSFGAGAAVLAIGGVNLYKAKKAAQTADVAVTRETVS